MKSKWIRLGILVTLLVLVGALEQVVLVEAQGPTSTDVAIIRQAAQKIISESDLPALAAFKPDIERIRIQGEWGLVEIFLYEKGTGKLLATEPLYFIAHYEAGEWQVALLDDPRAEAWLKQFPDPLLTPALKSLLIVDTDLKIATGQTFTGYKLPWACETGKTLTRSISHGGDFYYALDFADGTLFEIYAAKGGVVDNWHDECANGDELCTNSLSIRHDDTNPVSLDSYYHLAQGSIPDKFKQIGAIVEQGELIARADDTGDSTGHHLHFHVSVYPNWWISEDVIFDDVSSDGGRPRRRDEGGEGQPNDWFISGNCPASIPPTTSHSLSGTAGENGWYRSDVQATLTATDNSGSGIKQIEYKIDDGDWQSHTGDSVVVPISGDGDHTLYYKAEDNAGNQDEEKQVSVKIDATAPANPTTANPGCTASDDIWQNTCNDPNFTWSGYSDATSGVDSFQVYWGPEANGTGTTSTTTAGHDPAAVRPGTYYLRVRTKDIAGNWSNWQTLFTFRYDNVAPSSSIDIDGEAGNNDWYLTPVEITLTATDDLAGLQETNYRIDGGTWQIYQAPLTLVDEGITNFEFRSIDQAGNVEPTQQLQIKIDTRPPLVNTWSDQADYTRIESFIVRYTISDPEPGSGLDTVVAAFDGQIVVADQTIDLFWADLGSYTLEVTTSDYAGWTAADQASFNLIASLESLQGTVDRLCELGDIDNRGVCKALSQKLEHALQKRDAEQIKVATNTLKAFIKQVEAQAGKHISARGADILLMDAQYVIEYLN